MKRLMSIVFAALVLSVVLIPAACAEIEMMPYASEYFTGYGATLSNAGNCVIKIVFSAEGTEICDEIGVVNFEVEKYDGSNWEDVTGLVSGETGEDVVSYTFSRYFQGVEGEKYRVQVTFMSTIDGSTEFKTFTSGVITAQQARG